MLGRLSRSATLLAGSALLGLAAGARVASPAPAPIEQGLRQQCLDAMRRATRFMVDRVSTRGGYVWQYLPDMSRRWGEMEAYETMIWVQPPGTASMGHLFLDAYRATGDETYYAAAERAARALVWGQLDCGGWNYVVDFAGDRSLRHWYATIGKNGWRLEEFQHYYGNATFDDDVSSDAARFLLRIYIEKLDPAFRPPLDRAIRFVLESQYPSGGWPQRYPLRSELSHHGKPDYTSFITFNDDVAWENVRFLVECYVALGDPRLLEPIRRGMDVYPLTQGGAPQAGWGQQYTLDLRPVGARTYEPDALLPEYTAAHTDLLMRFYRLTGESRYLARIPEALAWLERCRLPEAMRQGGRFTHPTFVELGTDKPLFVHRRGSNVVNGAYFVDGEDRNLLAHYGGKQQIDVARLRERYAALLAIPVREATKGSPLLPARAPEQGAPGRLPAPWAEILGQEPTADDSVPGDDAVRRIVSSLDAEGRWLTRRGMTSHPYRGDGLPGPATDAFATTHVGDETDTSPYPDSSGQEYISTAAYIANMRALVAYVGPRAPAATTR